MKSPNNQNTIRTFIAIPIPENISLFLNKIQDKIKENRIKASWVKRSSMHLTLKFIGDTTKKDIKQIIRAMEATASICEPFTLSARKVGIFPDVNKARVIWSGVKGQIDQLKAVHITLEKNLEQAGIKADNKRFSPHFTLGRFKGGVDSRALVNIIQNFQHYKSDPYLVKSMVLFKSDLKPSGAVHTELFEIRFAGTI
ncbi:MAG: RNA 2',3'-cyclic phosphodiesterase [Desulfobacteraceae bacterium]|nr:RNA 2',3'-cyclic phosphodiesterase [Desulfobacteraceae bacterium]